ncbi:MAG: hypothetical protein KF841_09555 [Phycisphaerae bacterium]|nr:hypothetical protein [Phycisphaerae bacterium]
MNRLIISISWLAGVHLACGALAGTEGIPTTAPTSKKVRIRGFELESRHLLVDGIDREYLLFVPSERPNASDAPPMPLVMMLHGGGGNARQAADELTEGRWMELAERDRFSVAFPQGVGNHWNDCRSDDTRVTGAIANDTKFLLKMIDDIAGALPINSKQIYAAGVSNGGMMSFRLAIELPERLAAVCSCVGSVAANSECRTPTTPVPILYMVGTNDPLMPYGGGPIAPSARNPLGRGTVLSAMQTLDFWRTVNHADATPTIEHLPDSNKDDDSYVVITAWRPDLSDADPARTGGTASGETGSHTRRTQKNADASGVTAEVVYYEMIGGGHGWPGGRQHGLLYQRIVGRKNLDFNATDETWKFFSRHAKQ